MSYTPISDIAPKVAKLKQSFQSGKTLSLSFRKHQICDAVDADLNMRADMRKFEVTTCLKEINTMLENMDEWASNEKRSTNLLTLDSSAHIQRQPLGVCCIIAPWNYPCSLLLVPLIGCIAAGNVALLKPSEVSVNTSSILHKIIKSELDPSVVDFVLGGPQETTEVLKQKFDHIFYTGNGHVARIVAAAAAKNLTPCVLELGGKSPLIVDETVSDFKSAAERIIWGKFANCGQTCISPDFVMVQKQKKLALIDALKQTITNFYGSQYKSSPDFGRIINERHCNRLKGLLDSVPSSSVILGGEMVEDEKYFSPTIVVDPPTDSKLMQEEIFGPILPILTFDQLPEVTNFISERPKPLALYIFSTSKQNQQYILQNTSSGGVTVNDCVVHAGMPSLPFGGVGDSGTGNYHGKASFDTFSHQRSVLVRPLVKDLAVRFPPYTKQKVGWLVYLATFEPPRFLKFLYRQKQTVFYLFSLALVWKLAKNENAIKDRLFR